jgi:hypothetical protein
MFHVIAILGLMGFLWIVAMYATFQEEPKDALDSERSHEKAA